MVQSGAATRDLPRNVKKGGSIRKDRGKAFIKNHANDFSTRRSCNFKDSQRRRKQTRKGERKRVGHDSRISR